MRWEDLPVQVSLPVQTEPMDPVQRRFLAGKAQEAVKHNPRIVDLEERLLALGGEAAAFNVKPWLVEALLERGMVFAGESRLYRRRTGRCHYNSARLWAASPHVRQLMPIIETTLKRLLYYGVVLSTEEAEQFWAAEKDNW
jgi:hypothetical protein